MTCTSLCCCAPLIASFLAASSSWSWSFLIRLRSSSLNRLARALVTGPVGTVYRSPRACVLTSSSKRFQRKGQIPPQRLFDEPVLSELHCRIVVEVLDGHSRLFLAFRAPRRTLYSFVSSPLTMLPSSILDPSLRVHPQDFGWTCLLQNKVR